MFCYNDVYLWQQTHWNIYYVRMSWTVVMKINSRENSENISSCVCLIPSSFITWIHNEYSFVIFFRFAENVPSKCLSTYICCTHSRSDVNIIYRYVVDGNWEWWNTILYLTHKIRKKKHEETERETSVLFLRFGEWQFFRKRIATCISLTDYYRLRNIQPYSPSGTPCSRQPLCVAICQSSKRPISHWSPFARAKQPKRKHTQACMIVSDLMVHRTQCTTNRDEFQFGNFRWNRQKNKSSVGCCEDRQCGQYSETMNDMDTLMKLKRR